MRAALYTAPGEPLAIENVELHDPGEGEVLVRLEASGVCHTDLSVAEGKMPFPPPLILGHEGAGIVEAVGPDVTRVAAGDRVIGSCIPVCGACWYCRHGHSNLCETLMPVSMKPRGSGAGNPQIASMSGLGTFAEYMLADETSLVKVSSDLPAEQLALLGCGLTTGLGAVFNTADVPPGSAVAVIGCGGVGQAVVQGARIAGAARIIAVDPVELKRKTAAHLGATDVVNPADGDPIEQVRAITGGRGVDYAFDAVGLAGTLPQAVAMARAGGAAVIIGVGAADTMLTVSVLEMVMYEKRVLGSSFGSANVQRDFDRFLALAETGRLDLGSMVTRTIALDEVNDALHAMRAGEVIRSVIRLVPS